MISFTVFGTIAAAIVCWAGSEVARAPHHRRLLWTVAAGFMIVHSVAAFATIYGWRSDVAYAATARQTRAVLGMSVGSGIYVNYAFVLFWTADVFSWWRSPERYAARPAGVWWLVHGVVFFMFLNGAVIFADGLMRALGAGAVFAVLLSWIRKR